MNGIAEALSDYFAAIGSASYFPEKEGFLKLLQTVDEESHVCGEALGILLSKLTRISESKSSPRDMPPSRPLEQSVSGMTELLEERMKSMQNIDRIMDQLLEQAPRADDQTSSVSGDDVIALAQAISLPKPERSACFSPSGVGGGIDEYCDDLDPGYTARESLRVEHAAEGSMDQDELFSAHIDASPEKTLWFDFMGNAMEVDRNDASSQCDLSLITKSTHTVEHMMLPVIHESFKSGFQLSKQFDASVGTIVGGRYEVMGVLGSAAFSTALKALDLFTKNMVCLKVIKNEKDYFDQSLDEIKILRYLAKSGDLDKNHCLKIFDYMYFKEHLIIVTELLRDNLYDFSRYLKSHEETYFTIGKLQVVASQILTGVSYIHSLGLIHCDLKPENILFKSYTDCNVKIIDFGSSCFVTDRMSTYLQSRCYRAPEVLLGCRPYNNKIDMWSVGCIIAELWTGSVLFPNTCVQGIIARIQGIIGKFPDHMLREGHNVDEIFIDRQTQHVFVHREPDSGYDGLPRVDRSMVILEPKRSSLFQRMHINDTNFLDFISKLLQLDPQLRLSADEALRHPWLTTSRYSDGLR